MHSRARRKQTPEHFGLFGHSSDDITKNNNELTTLNLIDLAKKIREIRLLYIMKMTNQLADQPHREHG